MTYIYTEHDYLAHHGIKGMRWGIRRFQKEDGSLTPKGKNRYSSDSSDQDEEARKAKRKRAIKIAVGVTAATAVIAAAGGLAYSKAKYDKNIELGAKAALASKNAEVNVKTFIHRADQAGTRAMELGRQMESHSNPRDFKTFEKYQVEQTKQRKLENRLWANAKEQHGIAIDEHNKAVRYNDAANKTFYGKHYAPTVAETKEQLINMAKRRRKK